MLEKKTLVWTPMEQACILDIDLSCIFFSFLFTKLRISLLLNRFLHFFFCYIGFFGPNWGFFFSFAKCPFFFLSTKFANFLEKRSTNFSISQNWKKNKKKPPNLWMILVARWAWCKSWLMKAFFQGWVYKRAFDSHCVNEWMRQHPMD